jgi:pimeloyl-ACP methyl ester carboxylesterase
MNRRDVLKFAAVASMAVGGAPLAASAQNPPKTYVLVHGAWVGGWFWRRVSDRLRAAGHNVFTPTFTGLGERAHLLSKDIALDTFIQDVANVITYEELADVVLVGESFGGIVITGVADSMPQSIRHLVYLDALILQSGQTAFGVLPENVVAARKKAAEETSGGLTLPVPPPSAFAALGVTEQKDKDWLARHARPHPLRTYETPLNIKGPVGNNLPRSYIVCTEPYYAVTESSRNWVKQQSGWEVIEIAHGHAVAVTAPDQLATLLMRIA